MHFISSLALFSSLCLVSSVPLIEKLPSAVVEPRSLSPNNILVTIDHDIDIVRDVFWETNRNIENLVSMPLAGGQDTGNSRADAITDSLGRLANAAEQTRWGVDGDLADSQVTEDKDEIDAMTHDIDCIVTLTKDIVAMFDALLSRPPDSSRPDQTLMKNVILSHLKGIFQPMAEFAERIIGADHVDNDDDDDASICSLEEASNLGKDYFEWLGV